MSQEAIAGQSSALRSTLFILRVTLGIFLLQWGIEKIFFTSFSININRVFYGEIVPGTQTVWQIIGVLEVLLAVSIIAGFQQRWTYLIGFIVHGISTVSSWERLINPYATQMISMQARGPEFFPYPFNHLFMTAVPVLAAFWLIYRLRESDTMFALDHRGG